MKYDYTLTLADYRAGVALYTRQKWSRRIGSLFLYRFLPSIALLTLSYELYQIYLGQYSFAKDPPWQLILPLICLLMPFTNWNLTRKQFKLMFPSPNRNLSIDLDNERIICVNPGTSESRFAWNGILSFAQDDRIAIIFVAKGRFLFFPTSGLSSDQRAELQALMERNLPRKQPC